MTKTYIYFLVLAWWYSRNQEHLKFYVSDYLKLKESCDKVRANCKNTLNTLQQLVSLMSKELAEVSDWKKN